MSPFLPDLQLFLLMLCCLGGPLWGGNLPCAPSSLPQCPYPRPLSFNVVNTPGAAAGGGAGQGDKGGVGVGMGEHSPISRAGLLFNFF